METFSESRFFQHGSVYYVEDRVKTCFLSPTNATEDYERYKKIRWRWSGNSDINNYYLDVLSNDEELDKVVALCKKEKWYYDRLKGRVMIMGKYDEIFSAFKVKTCVGCGIEFDTNEKRTKCQDCESYDTMIKHHKNLIIEEKRYFEGNDIYSFQLLHKDNYYVDLDYWKNKFLRIFIDKSMPHREAAKKEILIHARVKKLFKKYAYSEKSEVDKALKDFAKWCKDNRLKCENARKSLQVYKRIEERSKPYIERNKRVKSMRCRLLD